MTLPKKMLNRPHLNICIPLLNKFERRLIGIRFLCLMFFALIGLLLSIHNHELERLSATVLGVKVCDSFGEAISEAFASGAEEEMEG